MTTSGWETGQAITQWDTGLPGTGWTVGYVSIGMSHLSLEYVIIPVAATQDGASYDPTSDTVQFAFMATPTQVPQDADWVSGSWETDSSNVLYPYCAKCLVGPGGTITPGIGSYVMYIRVTDNPEVPVLVCGILSVS